MKPAGRAIAALSTLAVVAAAFAVHGWRNARVDSPASRAQVDAALGTRGVAWIWPSSNGPVADRAAGYREAAVLVETLVIHAGGVERMPRMQPLALPSDVKLLPVLHVEAAVDAPDTFSNAQLDDIVAAFSRHAAEADAGAGMLQLDFEAPRRERAAYQALVARTRAALPARTRLSVTALAHWCTESDWLDHLQVDEVVPMLYRLGPQLRIGWRTGCAATPRWP